MEEYKDDFQKTFITVINRNNQLLFEIKNKISFTIELYTWDV